MVKVFVPRERRAGEKRVAATPDSVKRMVAAGVEVALEAGAGVAAHIPDGRYADAGAKIVASASAAAEADVVVRVAPPTPEEVATLREGAVVIGLLAPDRHLEVVEALAARKVSALAMELVPRITRAQEMDALSSQASIAGYKAVLLAASRLDKYFPLLMTAAGTIPPARVVIMGAGVAGLQAIATARRLGAIVEVSDVRQVVQEQVESLGAKFIPLPKQDGSGQDAGGYARQMSEDFLREQRDIVSRHVAAADVVICTALVPGKKAPTLVTRAMVEAMRPGAVVVDLAVEQGGNCELSKKDEDVDHGGVLILGPSALAADTPGDASQLYARNVWALLASLLKDGQLVLDPADEVVDGALLVHGGEVRHAPTREKLQGGK